MALLAKDDSSAVKGMLRAAPDREWDTLVDEKVNQRATKIKKRDEIEGQLSKLRKKLQHLRIVLATHKDKDLVTLADIQAQERKIKEGKLELKTLREQENQLSIAINKFMHKLDRIDVIKEQFPIEELREKLEAQQDIARSLNNLQHEYEKEKTLLKTQERSIKKLDEVSVW